VAPVEQKWRRHRQGGHHRGPLVGLTGVSWSHGSGSFRASGGTTHKTGATNSLERTDDRNRSAKPNLGRHKHLAWSKAAKAPMYWPSISPRLQLSQVTLEPAPINAMPNSPTAITMMPTIRSLQGYLTYPDNALAHTQSLAPERLYRLCHMVRANDRRSLDQLFRGPTVSQRDVNGICFIAAMSRAR